MICLLWRQLLKRGSIWSWHLKWIRNIFKVDFFFSTYSMVLWWLFLKQACFWVFWKLKNIIFFNIFFFLHDGGIPFYIQMIYSYMWVFRVFIYMCSEYIFNIFRLYTVQQNYGKIAASYQEIIPCMWIELGKSPLHLVVRGRSLFNWDQNKTNHIIWHLGSDQLYVI